MFFQVKHPQLEYEPGQFREGIKRYNFHKNMNSYEYPTNPLPANQSLQNYSPEPFRGASSEILNLKQQLLMKQKELDKIKSLEQTKSNNASPPVKMYKELIPIRNNRTNRSSYDFDIFEVSKHPAFQQPKFTKKNPKVMQTNPISVYNDRYLGQYGSMIISNKDKIV